MELDKIKEIVAGVLHVDENSITADTKFVDDLGADSLDLTSIVMEIEEQFGIEIPDEIKNDPKFVEIHNKTN